MVFFLSYFFLIFLFLMPTYQSIFLNLPKRTASTSYQKYMTNLQSKVSAMVIHSGVVNFAPWLELHHIVLLQDKSRPSIACAIDFSPLNQTDPKTLITMLAGKSVPAEVRVNWIANFDGETESIKELAASSSSYSPDNLIRYRYPPADSDPMLVRFVDNILETWPKSMQFYFRNCQHFSAFVTKSLQDL